MFSANKNQALGNLAVQIDQLIAGARGLSANEGINAQF
jgi:hypothetical protein